MVLSSRRRSAGLTLGRVTMRSQQQLESHYCAKLVDASRFIMRLPGLGGLVDLGDCLSRVLRGYAGQRDCRRVRVSGAERQTGLLAARTEPGLPVAIGTGGAGFRACGIGFLCRVV